MGACGNKGELLSIKKDVGVWAASIETPKQDALIIGRTLAASTQSILQTCPLETNGKDQNLGFHIISANHGSF